MPDSEVVAVTHVTVNGDVTFTRVGVDKDDSVTDLASHCLDLRIGPVVGDGGDDTAVVSDLALDGLKRGDQVREISGSRSPAHGQSTVVTATVGASVGTVLVLTSIITKDTSPLLVSGERKDTGVLEHDSRLGSRAANGAEVVHANVNVLVDELVANLCVVVLVSVSVALPAVEVDRDGLVEADEVVGGHDTDSRIVETPLGNGTVEDGDGQVGSPEGLAGVEVGVTRHSHVQASKGGRHTRVLSIPIRHDESLEAKLTLQDVVLEVRVLADLGVVDLVVRAHDGSSSSTDGVGERPQVELVQSLVIQVGADGIDEAKVLKVTGLAEVLLLVHDEVLGAGNDTSVLDTADGVGDGMASQHWIRGETFPVTLGRC